MAFADALEILSGGSTGPTAGGVQSNARPPAGDSPRAPVSWRVGDREPVPWKLEPLSNAVAPPSEGDKDSGFGRALGILSGDVSAPPIKQEAPSDKNGPAWHDFVTDIPSEVSRAVGESWQAMKDGLNPFNTERITNGPVKNTMLTGKGLLAISVPRLQARVPVPLATFQQRARSLSKCRWQQRP